MKRLPSHAERAARARQQAQRQAELLGLADALRAEIAHVGRDLALVAFDPGGEPPSERVAAQLARLEAARAAAQLARLLVEVDAPDRAVTLAAELQAALGRWRRASEGWWEARIVWRPRVRIDLDAATGQIALAVVMHPFGPYFYRHWRADGRQQSAYFGRQRPDGFPAEDDIARPTDARPVAPLSALGREALALADRLSVAYNAAERGQERQQRLRRVLRAAGRRVERRLRAERLTPADLLGVPDELLHTTNQEAPLIAAALPLGGSNKLLSVPDELLHTTNQEAPSVAAALVSPSLTRLSELAEDLDRRSQLGQRAALEAHSDIVAGVVALRTLVARRAALEAAQRRLWANLPVGCPEDDPQLAQVIALVPKFPASVALSERAAVQLAQVRGVVRGRALVAWRDLVAELRRELRQVEAQVEDLAGRNDAAGVPVQAWLTAADALAGGA